MLKPTFFKTGPESVVPVRNITSGDKPSYPIKDEGFKGVNAKSKPPINVGDSLKTIKPNNTGTVDLDKKSALKQLVSALKGNGNPIGDLTEDQQNSILGEKQRPGEKLLNGYSKASTLTKNKIEKINATLDLGGTKNLILNGDINSVNGVVGVINTLASGDVLKVNDFTSKMGLIQGIMGDLQRYGILDAIDYVLKSMEDIKTKKLLLSKMVPIFFINADIKNLNVCIKTLGSGKVMALYPKGISAFCSGFRYPYNSSPEHYAGFRNQILDLFNNLDPEWNLITRNGVKINNLECLTYMSSNFYRIFNFIDHTTLSEDIYPTLGLSREEQSSRFSSVVLMAKNYPVVSIPQFLSRRYPKASFTFRRVLN